MKRFFPLLLFCVTFCPCSTNAQISNNFKIQGVIKGFKNAKILLGNIPIEGYSSAFKIVHYDSCISSGNGFFSFKGELSSGEPQMFSIESPQAKGWKSVFICKGESVFITGNKDSLYESKVSGAKIYDDYLNYRVLMSTIRRKISELLKREEAIGIKDKVAYQRIDDSIRLYNTLLHQKLLEFVKEYPDNYISLYELNSYHRGINIDTAKKYFKMLSPRLRGYSLGKKLRYKIFELSNALSVGHNTPTIKCEDIYGQPFDLKSLLGQYVLIDFWASWCGPCMKNNPMLRNLSEQYAKSRFKIVSFSLDTDKKKWIGAAIKDKANWINISDLQGESSMVSLHYGLNTIPRYILVDPNGKIILDAGSKINLAEAKIKELLLHSAIK